MMIRMNGFHHEIFEAFVRSKTPSKVDSYYVNAY
jgi:hypothetical protein